MAESQKFHFISSPQGGVSQLRGVNGKLYSRGWCNLGWEKVLDILSQGKFPKDIRGNFGFVYITENEVIAAVDHLCTYPIFYFKNKFAFNFFELVKTIPQFDVVQKVRLQMKMLGGHHLSEETTVRGMKRLMPGTFLRDGKSTVYIKLEDLVSDGPLDRKAFRQLFEERMAFYAGKRNTLMFTSGTDSATLAGIFKKLGLVDHLDVVHAYSDISFKSEKPLVQAIGDEMGLNVDFVLLEPASMSEINRIHDFRIFWWDYSFWPKKIALEARPAEPRSRRVFTGEIGDQLFGGSKLNALVSYAVQSQKISPEEIADLWINKSGNNRHFSTVTRAAVKLHPSITDLLEYSDSGRAAYQEIKERLVQVFQSVRSRDIISRFQFMNFITKGPFRLWPYSQDHQEDWVHPFADWEVVKAAFGCSSSERIYRGGTSKALLYDLWSDYLSQTPWTAAKAGTQAHVRREFRNLY